MRISKKKKSLILTFILVFQVCWVNSAQAEKLGDLTGDDEVNISDVVFLINLILNPPEDGFTKLGSAGEPLSLAATEWSCVKDNVTGLIWEVKTDDGEFRDKDWTYSWFNSTGINDEGYPGKANGGICFDSINCDIEKFVQQVNNQGLCGHNDWRMPALNELESIISSEYKDPAIDTRYFPRTYTLAFWSASPEPAAVHHFSSNAWYIHFYFGALGDTYKGNSLYVRLVRTGQ